MPSRWKWRKNGQNKNGKKPDNSNPTVHKDDEPKFNSSYGASTGTKKKVLLIGETGSGKSTFVNTITNYFRHGTLDKMKIAIPTRYLASTENFASDELSVKDRSSSQTDSCTPYDLGQYVFIDTPGLNDTRGQSQDEMNMQKISEAATKAGDIAALVFIMNGSNARMTLGMRNIVSHLRGHMPDCVLANVIVVLTNTTQNQSNFDTDEFKKHFTKATVFYMNNSAFSSDANAWSAVDRHTMAINWSLSMKTVASFTDRLSRMVDLNTGDFAKMHRIRMDLKQSLHGSRLEFKQVQDVCDAMEAAEKRKAQSAANMKQNSNFTSTETVVTHQLLPADYHSTICSSCNHVCHDGCGLPEIRPGTDKNAFKRCAAMSGDNCRVCEGRCSYDKHYHDRKTMKEVRQSVEKVLEDVKKKYEAACSDAQKAAVDLSTHADKQKMLEGRIEQIMTDIKGKCEDLRKLCSGFNLVEELTITIGQMEQEALDLTSIDARKAAQMAIDGLKKFVDALQAGDQSKRQEKHGKVEIVKVDLTQKELLDATSTTASQRFGRDGAKGRGNSFGGGNGGYKNNNNNYNGSGNSWRNGPSTSHYGIITRADNNNSTSYPQVEHKNRVETLRPSPAPSGYPQLEDKNRIEHVHPHASTLVSSSGHAGAVKIEILDGVTEDKRDCAQCKRMWTPHRYDIVKSNVTGCPQPESCLSCRGVVVDSFMQCGKCSMEFFYTVKELQMMIQNRFSPPNECVACRG